MAYQVTSKTSYGQRVTGSFKKIASGFVMFIIGTILLFWNEGNFVKTKKSLQEAEGVLVNASDVSGIDPALDGKLIHASAFADTKDVLNDDLFGLHETAISIRRKAEYYQYEENAKKETRERIGGSQETITTYTYEARWTSSPVNSANFHDPDYRSANFVLADVDDKTQYATNVTFGGYKLPTFIISSISGSIAADSKLTPEECTQWEDVIARNMKVRGLKADSATRMTHVDGNVVYLGKSPSSPGIGDVRVTLTKILPADISIIARVVGNTFERYTASNGKTVSSVAMGTVSAETMFAGKHSANRMWTWILRIVGFLLVAGGLKSMFSILPTLFKVLPFLGNIVGAGVGLVCNVIGGVWSLVIIAIAWLWYRPLTGILLLAAAVAGIWYLKKKGKK